MAYTFEKQQDKLSSLLGDSNTSTDDMFPLAQRKTEINRGEVRFASDSKVYRNYVSGTVASLEVAIPADWTKNYILVINDKIISNNREIALSDWERYYNWGGEIPFFYMWQESGDKVMKLLGNSDSINGQTYKLWYFAKPTTDLDLDADESVFPDEYREASAYYAASELLEQIGKTDLSTRYLQKYGLIVAGAIERAGTEYVDKEYAVPDLGDNDTDNTTDIQGVHHWG